MVHFKYKKLLKIDHYLRLGPNHYKTEQVKLDNSLAYTFGVKPEAKKREDTPAPNSYKPERIITKVGPAYTFGYKPDDPNNWVNLARQIALNYNAKRRGSDASAGTYDVGEEIKTNGYSNGTGKGFALKFL